MSLITEQPATCPSCGRRLLTQGPTCTFCGSRLAAESADAKSGVDPVASDTGEFAALATALFSQGTLLSEIRAQLTRKGVPEKRIDSILANTVKETDAYKRCLETATGMLEKNVLPSAIKQELTRGFVDPEIAEYALQDLIEPIYNAAHSTAFDLLREGASKESVVQRLVGSGTNSETAQEAVDDVVWELDEVRRINRREWLAAIGSGVGFLLTILLGFLFLLGGFALYVGNRTGWFPTIPMAGFITMGVGTLILAAATGSKVSHRGE